MSDGKFFRIGLEFQNFRLQQHHFEQIVYSAIFLGGNLHKNGVSAPVLGHDTDLGQFSFDPFGICIGLVDFIDRYDNRNFCGLGMVDGFYGLRHDAVIGGNHKNDQIGNLCPAGAHLGKRFMARGIQKNDLAFIRIDIVSADMLRDSAGFILRNFGFTNDVKKRCFAVIHVTHDGDHRGPGDELVGIIRFDLQDGLFFKRGFFKLIVEFRSHQRGGVKIDHLIHRHHNAEVHQLFDHFTGFYTHTFRQVRQGDGVVDFDSAFNGLGYRNLRF